MKMLIRQVLTSPLRRLTNRNFALLRFYHSLFAGRPNSMSGAVFLFRYREYITESRRLIHFYRERISAEIFARAVAMCLRDTE